MNVTTLPCVVCGKTSQVKMTDSQFARITNGERIASIFPEKTPDERELLITGTHDKCWDSMFSADDMDDDGAE